MQWEPMVSWLDFIFHMNSACCVACIQVQGAHQLDWGAILFHTVCSSDMARPMPFRLTSSCLAPPWPAGEQNSC